MSSLLYHSISSGLSPNELDKIDERISQDHEFIYFFLTELTLRSKRKIKKIFRHIGVTVMLNQPLISVVFPLLPTNIHKLNYVRDEEIKTYEKHSKIVPLTEPKIDKVILSDQQIEDLNIISYKLKKGSITIDKAILELRAGGIDFDVAFSILLTSALVYMMHINQVQGFQATYHYPPRIGDWGNINNNGFPNVKDYGKGAGPKSITVRGAGAKNSEFEGNLIQDFYSKIPNLSVEGKNWEITSWSAAKHIHHSPDFGLDPTKYGMTQADLDNIADVGLINHIYEGRTPPNPKYVRALQKCWKKFAEHENVKNCGIQPVMGENCYVLKHMPTGIFLAFKVDNEESFTGYCLSESQSIRHNLKGIIGKTYPKN